MLDCPHLQPGGPGCTCFDPVPLRETPTAAQDVPGALRKLADRIESGDLGEIAAVGVVTLGNGLDVFGYGRDAEPGKLTLMFSRAIHRFVMGVS